MNAKKAFLLAMIAFEAAIIMVNSTCSESLIAQCRFGCQGRPRCNGKRCGNVENVCYCDCSTMFEFKCRQTTLGWAWNSGARNPDGSFKFNGVMGDGKHYRC